MIHFLLAALLALPAYALEMPTTDYQIVAASQTTQALGPNGKKGDILQRLIIVPETTAAGTVSIRDGSSAAAAYNSTVLVSGTLSDLKPYVVELGARSISGSWSVTTGANVHVIAVGRFD